MLSDSNPVNVGIRGKVIDETMKTLVIRGMGTHKIAKQDAVFKFLLDGVAVKVEGKAYEISEGDVILIRFSV